MDYFYRFIKYSILVIALFVVLYVGVRDKVIDFIWFSSLGYSKTFLVYEGIRFSLWFIKFLLAFLILFFEFHILFKFHFTSIGEYFRYHLLRNVRWMETFHIYIIGMGIAFLVSSFFSSDPSKVILFFYGKDFGYKDPIFGFDLSFFFYTVPMVEYIFSFLFFSWLLSFWIVVIFYIMRSGRIDIRDGFSSVSKTLTTGFRYFLSFNAILFFLFAFFMFSFILPMELLYSKHKFIIGADYTDTNVRLYAYYACAFISLIMVPIVLFSIKKRVIDGFISFVMGLGYVGLLVVIGWLFPFVYDKIFVEPNQLAMEKRYIALHIKWTRFGFGLQEVRKIPLSFSDSSETKIPFRLVKKYVRLWDYRPLITTYSQLQEIRTYYQFHSVDIDRYWVNGEAIPIYISPRELSIKELPYRRWINSHLEYTHGYGIVASTINDKTEGGKPFFIVKDIPPRVVDKRFLFLSLKRPEIYFGEITNNYVIVNTKIKEFGYPSDSGPKYTRYRGSAGIRLSNFFMRFLFSKYSPKNILFSNFITNESRILLYRNILDRAKKLFPYLRFDRDPYIVVANGRLYWFLDGYITSDRMIYSRAIGGINYIRNVVKVIIDAYTGEVSAYYINEDPIFSAYLTIFQSYFKPIKYLDDELKKHIRYPRDLFSLQISIYRSYHIDDPTVFYNSEDLWDFPEEIYENNTVKVLPYYLLLHLPEINEERFVITYLYTPYRKKNLIAFMVGICDYEDYGKIIAYILPRTKLIYGPMQIEALINQDASISKELSLWNQRGSSVIRGNLIFLPYKDTYIYVEPLYLKAESNNIPELKKVIVVWNNKIVMEDSLDIALKRLYKDTFLEREVSDEKKMTSKKEGNAFIEKLLKIYIKAKKSLQKLNFRDFGVYFNELGKMLEQHKR